MQIVFCHLLGDILDYCPWITVRLAPMQSSTNNSAQGLEICTCPTHSLFNTEQYLKKRTIVILPKYYCSNGTFWPLGDVLDIPTSPTSTTTILLQLHVFCVQAPGNHRPTSTNLQYLLSAPIFALLFGCLTIASVSLSIPLLNCSLDSFGKV
jgi:hypothetical protein